MKNKTLSELVLEQIQTDISNGDLTAVEILLEYVPEYVLKGYLPEEMVDD
tara:strand:+ start:409 stop:558 length:150 start_codon:yes stop_codon:yes gene_type:complete